MRPLRPRYVTLCQQLLALGVVLAALVPASGVVSLDVVGERPGSQTTTPREPARVGLSAYAHEAGRPGVVATTPGTPVVTEVALTPAQEGVGRRVQIGRRVVSAPQVVSDDGMVGVTWGPVSHEVSEALSVEVRTSADGVWSGWESVEADPEHAPDPGSREARRARPGTEPVFLGDVDLVQVRIETDRRGLPGDMRLAVIEPGAPVPTELAEPEIDTATITRDGLDLMSSSTDNLMETADNESLEGSGDAADLDLATTSVTPKPRIFSRAQWGADERMRDAGSLRYYEVNGGFVHHTVNANDYKRRDVPALMRSIYAYHTKSRGWSDIGYNFLVDRFGRIWEGRYGGVDRPVVGAHTLSYNEYSFAMSAIGNFETVRPPRVMLEAYAALFAWKLSLHGVRADSMYQRIGSTNFRALNGHSDAASTACPGRYLFKKIGKIRRLASAIQADWSGREMQVDLVGEPVKDLVVRRRSDNRGFIVPLRLVDGRLVPGNPIDTKLDLGRTRAVLSVGDWDRDGFNDIITQSRKGGMRVRRGDGTGGFEPRTIKLKAGYRRFDMLTAAGDMTGDGYPDLIGQPRGEGVRIFPGAGLNGLGTSYVAYGRVNADQMVGVGRWNTDGAPDVVIRRDNTLTVWGGNGPGGLIGSAGISMDVSRFDWIVGAGVTGLSDHADLIVKKAGKGGLFVIPGSTTGFGKRVRIGRGFAKYDLVG